jgi:hypothetical protein
MRQWLGLRLLQHQLLRLMAKLGWKRLWFVLRAFKLVLLLVKLLQ